MSEQQHPDELLPWYVNGTLTGTELADVEAHVTACPRCQDEITVLRAMHAAAKVASDTIPSEFAWQRLRRDMKQPSTTQSKKRQWWIPSMAAAALLVIAVQSVIILNLTPSEGGYGLAGKHLPGAIVQVKFNPAATEEQVRNSLQAVSADIVAGPSATGLYMLRLSDEAHDPAVNQKILSLMADKGVIDYVQRD
jgi:hypothetical protein